MENYYFENFSFAHPQNNDLAKERKKSTQSVDLYAASL
jgi:hypothetical protein